MEGNMSSATPNLQPIINASGYGGKDPVFPDLAMHKPPPKEPVAIADMAVFFGVTHRTLHFYEEKGLIAAQRIGLMRVYDRHQVTRMGLINVCREVGMPVSVIQDLFDTLATATSKSEANLILEEALLARRRELAADLSTVHRQLHQINALLEHEDATSDGPAAKQKGPALTDTETSCLQLMAEGYTPLRIARTLELKTDDVAALEGSIIGKLQAHNRFQAVAKAVLLGMVAN
jgi:DNA-binding transcriptional MerR regulator